MQTSTEIRNLLRTWTTENRLFSDNDYDDVNPNQLLDHWIPGKMFIVMPTNRPSAVATMALTSNQTKLYGISITDDFPHVISVDIEQVREPIKSLRLPLANVQTLANRKEQRQFINRTRGTKHATHKIMYLPPILTKAINGESMHPAIIHTQARTMKTLPNSHDSMQWLQAACIQAPDNRDNSNLSIPINIEPIPLPNDISDLIEAEIKEVHPSQAKDLIQALRDQATIHPISETPHMPEQRVQDLTESPDTETTPPPKTNPFPKSPIPKTVTLPPAGNPTPFTNNQGQPQRPTVPPAGLPQATGAATSPYHPSHVFPTPTHPPFQDWQPQPPTASIDNQIVAKANKQLAMLFDKPNLTTEDWQRIKTCESIRSTYSASPNTEPPHNDHRIYHLLGWSGYSNMAQFHSATNNMWNEILKINTAGPRETKVAHLIVHPLKKTYFELQELLHHDWIKMVAAFEFSPELHGKGNKQGLGPLAYVTRTLRELQLVQQQRDIMKAASSVSTQDVAKARLGAPIMPDSIFEVIAILRHQMNVLRFLFTPFCPLLSELDKVYHALQRNASILSQTPDFQWSIAAEILWQLSGATKTFFDHTTGPLELQRNIRPHVDLSWLATSIATGTIQPSYTKSDLYMPPKTRESADRTTPPKRPRTEKSERMNRANRARDRPRAFTINHERQLPVASQKLIASFLEDPTARLPPVYIARRKLNLDSLDAFATQIGAQKGDCIRFNLYGKCTAPNCAHNHDIRPLADAHTKLIAQILSKGP